MTDILALIKAAELGAPLVSAALVLLLAATLAGAQFRKIYRQDKADSGIDKSYAGVIGLLEKQRNECLAECAKCNVHWAECEAHGRILERRIGELEQTIATFITRMKVPGTDDLKGG